MKISGINGIPPTPIAPVASQSPVAGFGELLGKFVDDVNDKQLNAQEAVKSFAAGKTENVHDVILAAAEADISFKMLLQTRNKLVEAYKEIMRMEV